VDVKRVLKAAYTTLKRPTVLTYRLRLIALNRGFRRRRARWLCDITGFPLGSVEAAIREIEQDTEFVTELRASLLRYTQHFPMRTDFMVASNGSSLFFHCVSVYALVRLVQPSVIVETGGTPGKSSAFITRALQRNQKGHLHTIDLPPVETDKKIRSGQMHALRPQGVRSNWCVPGSLQGYQTLLEGCSETVLPHVLFELGEIPMFIHDSDHSYENMRWELEAAFPFVPDRGLFWSDDITTNSAWADFCVAHGLAPHNFTSQGVAAKVSTLQ